MNASTFQVGDKVVLAFPELGSPATVPKLDCGKVYCVERTTISAPTAIFPAHQRLYLCGVRKDGRLRSTTPGLPFAAFRRVNVSTKGAP